MLKSFHQIGHWIHSRGRSLFGQLPIIGKSVRIGLGPAGERVAAKFLRSLGYRILEHSHRQRLGEIDLIALDGNCLVFVEVKTWRSGSDVDPSAAVDRRKQERITRASLIYLKQRRLLEQPARFDVVSIIWPSHQNAQPEIRHFKNAFEAVGHRQMFR